MCERFLCARFEFHIDLSFDSDQEWFSNVHGPVHGIVVWPDQ